MKITKVKGEKKRRTFQTEGTRWVQILIEDLSGELKVVYGMTGGSEAGRGDGKRG